VRAAPSSKLFLGRPAGGLVSREPCKDPRPSPFPSRRRGHAPTGGAARQEGRAPSVQPRGQRLRRPTRGGLGLGCVTCTGATAGRGGAGGGGGGGGGGTTARVPERARRRPPGRPPRSSGSESRARRAGGNSSCSCYRATVNSRRSKRENSSSNIGSWRVGSISPTKQGWLQK
jgi:hypothetical protein